MFVRLHESAILQYVLDLCRLDLLLSCMLHDLQIIGSAYALLRTICPHEQKKRMVIVLDAVIYKLHFCELKLQMCCLDNLGLSQSLQSILKIDYKHNLFLAINETQILVWSARVQIQLVVWMVHLTMMPF